MSNPGLVGAILVGVIGVMMAFVAIMLRSLAVAAALVLYALTIGLMIGYYQGLAPAGMLVLFVAWLMVGAYALRCSLAWLRRQNRSR